MISRHPKEFVYTPIDLSPLIDAVLDADKTNNWTKVHELINNGYSLQWIDANTRNTAVRMLAKRPGSAKIVRELLDISMKENGVFSEAHKFITIEATIGGLDNHDRCPINDIAERSNQLHFYRVYHPLAEMGATLIGHLALDETHDNTHIKPNHDTIYHLARGMHKDKALSHLIRLKIDLLNEKPNTSADDLKTRTELLENGIRAYMKALTLGINVDWNNVLATVNAALQLRDKDCVARIAIAEAVANGHDEWAFNLLDKMIESNDVNLDVVLGEAVISAARLGRTDIIFKLCERAKKAKVDKNKRFVDLLSCSAGAALVHEHFSLAKVIMQIIPEFNATAADMKELNAWPANKVIRMLRIIRDYKIFTDIALHSGVARNVNSPAWINALKAEYGLRQMSDAGFHTIVNNPEILHILLNYRIPGSGNSNQPAFDKQLTNLLASQFADHKLSGDDIQAFLIEYNKARVQLKEGKTSSISFFRLRHLTDLPHKHRQSPEAVQRSIEIKREISSLLRDYVKGMHLPATKRTIAQLHLDLNDAVSAGMIVKILHKYLEPCDKKLYEKCMDIIKLHPAGKANTQQLSKMK